MIKYFFIRTSTILLLACTSIVLNAQTKFTDDNWEIAKTRAIAENKILLVDLYFQGCTACVQMDEEVFPNETISKELNKDFINFKSDITKEEIGKKLCMKYGVTGFPTFLFMNGEGKIIDIISGYQSVEELSNSIAVVKKNASKAIFKKFSTQNETYPEFYSKAYLEGKRDLSFAVVDDYLKSQKDIFSEVPFVVITGLKVGGKYDDLFLKNAKKLATDYSQMQVSYQVISILRRKAEQFAEKKDLEAYKKLLSQVQPVFTVQEWQNFEPMFLKDYENQLQIN